MEIVADYKEIIDAIKASGGEAFKLCYQYVEKVIYRYLDCGILHNGFARARCCDCDSDIW